MRSSTVQARDGTVNLPRALEFPEVFQAYRSKANEQVLGSAQGQTDLGELLPELKRFERAVYSHDTKEVVRLTPTFSTALNVLESVTEVGSGVKIDVPRGVLSPVLLVVIGVFLAYGWLSDECSLG